MTGAAIVPLNIAALRVNSNDQEQITGQFRGRVAAFDQLGPHASTGDRLVARIESGQSAAWPLPRGLHLHWELPDHFRQGRQLNDGGALVFPAVPNRWLVTRYLRIDDADADADAKAAGAWRDVPSTSWIVESDALMPVPGIDGENTPRPAVPVPIATTAHADGPPALLFSYLGRVVTLADWLDGTAPQVDYLPAHLTEDGTPRYLDAVGFVGPGFSSYYPDCCSVFGFWDAFADQPALAAAIAANTPVRFEASYQVVGWLAEREADPLTSLTGDIAAAYAVRVAQCRAQGVAIDVTPAQIGQQLVERRCGWALGEHAFTAETDAGNGALVMLSAPDRTLCSGTMQSIAWDTTGAANISFLGDPGAVDGPGAVWSDTVRLAVANTPVEALSVLLKADPDASAPGDDPCDDDEMLLDALQFGLLYGIEHKTNRIADLEELLHARGFTSVAGGLSWAVQPALPTTDGHIAADAELTLPIALAERLALLNLAQKTYDQARAAVLAKRRQVFMDWFRYVRIYTGEAADPDVDINALSRFVSDAIAAVVADHAATGVLHCEPSKTTEPTPVRSLPVGAIDTLAAKVVAAWTEATAAIAGMPQAVVRAIPAPPFWLPNDPVLGIEGNRIEPVRRNGNGKLLPVRVADDLVDTITLVSGDTTASVAGATIAEPGRLAAAALPREVQALAIEARLTLPMLAGDIARAWAAQGGAGNPAAVDPAAAAAAIASAQGHAANGLHSVIHAAGAVPPDNPRCSASGTLPLVVTFTNAALAATLPSFVGVTAQVPLPELSPARIDPFLPTFLTWNAALRPLARGTGRAYLDGAVSGCWDLGLDAIDFAYHVEDGTPASFASATDVGYVGSNPLSKRPAANLIEQIERDIADHPDDPQRPELERLAETYARLRIVTQTLGGFNTQQVLRTPIPAIEVMDVRYGRRDAITTQLAHAATADPDDIWYDAGFTAQAPIFSGPMAQGNFGPLRGGLLAFGALEITDVFGQRMSLTMDPANPRVRPAYALRARPGDDANAALAILPPRLLAPTRLWFRWLSASHDALLDADFVEANAHPATSPVCGWIMPNHLDDTLLFYDAAGLPVGSFGIEHGTSVYRTRPGRLDDGLAADIGLAGAPTVNPHLARFMWHLDAQSPAYLTAMIAMTLAADTAVHPSRPAEDAGLAVLLGRPIAITRAVVSMETLGGLLPLDQARAPEKAGTGGDAPGPRYEDRQRTNSASLADVRFPLRLGDVANLDDGLIGYLVETETGLYGALTSAYAPVDTAAQVVRPQPWSLALTLNAAPLTVTILADPRAGIHAITGILPVEELSIPANQYADAVGKLAVSFAVHPVLRAAEGLVLPLPDEPGYDWEWVGLAPGAEGAVKPVITPLSAGAASGDARDVVAPQTLAEGWLRLVPQPVAQEGTTA